MKEYVFMGDLYFDFRFFSTKSASVDVSNRECTTFLRLFGVNLGQFVGSKAIDYVVFFNST